MERQAARARGFNPCRAKPHRGRYLLGGLALGIMGGVSVIFGFYLVIFAFSNFWFGLTWEYVTLGVMLAGVGLGLLIASWWVLRIGPQRAAARMAEMDRLCAWQTYHDQQQA